MPAYKLSHFVTWSSAAAKQQMQLQLHSSKLFCTNKLFMLFDFILPRPEYVPCDVFLCEVSRRLWPVQVRLEVGAWVPLNLNLYAMLRPAAFRSS